MVCPLKPSGVAATDRANIQTILDASQPCYLENGEYFYDQPLILKNDGACLFGSHMGDYTDGGTTLTRSDYFGPAVCLIPTAIRNDATRNLSYDTALLTGSGQALVLEATPANNTWFDLADVFDVRWDGWSTITIEGFFQTDGTEGYIFSSYGTLGGSTGDALYTSNSCNVYIDSSGKLNMALSVGGTLYTAVTASAVTVSTTHHFAIVLNSGTLDFYYNGSSISSQAAAGTIDQDLWEHMCIGARRDNWPHGDVETGATEGFIDSFRISGNARYTSGFTPSTAKFSADANTKILLNFTSETDSWFLRAENSRTTGFSSTDKFYIVKRGDTADGTIEHAEISGLTIPLAWSQTAIYGYGMSKCIVEDCNVSNGTLAFNFEGHSNNIFRRLRGIGLSAGQAFMVASRGGGTNYVENLVVTGYPAGYVSGGGGTFSQSWFHANAVLRVTLFGGHWAVLGQSVAEEDVSQAGILYGVSCFGSSASPCHATFIACNSEVISYPHPSYILKGEGSLTLINQRFTGNAGGSGSASQRIQREDTDSTVVAINTAEEYPAVTLSSDTTNVRELPYSDTLTHLYAGANSSYTGGGGPGRVIYTDNA